MFTVFIKSIFEGEEGRIAARFAFDGEGMSWDRDITLTLGAEGETLTRSETDPEAGPVNLAYSRCETSA